MKTDKSYLENITLHGGDLLSKWGFNDGDILYEWSWHHYDDHFPENVSEHEWLAALVETHLIPVVIAAGHTIKTYRIGTIHNPIRAEMLDGREVDDYVYSSWLYNVSVTLTTEQILALRPDPMER